ncbi:dynein axonemal heavy chain 6-like isoform X2 [Rhopilema esculentum]
MELSRSHEKPWPSVELLFGSDDEYQRYIADIVQHISVEIRNVEEYADMFVDFCNMVDTASKVNVERALQRQVWSADQFNAVLGQFTDQISAMSSMADEKRVGMFLVKSVKFRESCLPYPQGIVAAVSHHLPQISCSRNEALLKVIKSSELKLERTPFTVEDFVEHLAFLARMSNEVPSLDKEFKVVSGLFQIAIKFSLDFSAEEWALYRTLGPSFTQLKATILYCEAKKDEHIQKFMKDLKNMVAELRKYLHNVKNKVRSPVLLDEDVVPQAAMENITMLMEDVELIGQRSRNYASYQDRFGDALSTAVKKRSLMLEETGYGISDPNLNSASVSALQNDLSEVERDLTLRKLLWESMEEWEVLVNQWKSTHFDALAVDDVQKDVTRFVQTVFLLEKGLPPNPVVPKLKKKVMKFKQGMPVISSLRNTALRERHWNEIQEIIGTKVVRDKLFTLGDLLQLKIFQYKEKIAEISSQASNEATLEQMLQRVIEYWNFTDFQLVAHTSRDIAIIVSADEIITTLEECQVTLGNIKGSRFSQPIKGLVEEWERKLNLFGRTFEEWMLVQRNWLYLETIFSAADIQRQLPNESKLFNVVDKNWKDIMRRVIDNPNALKASTAAGVLEILQSCNTNLEKVHRSLEDYLETKRLVFARFYFLSNEELLDILANTKNPAAVQPHLKKCFGNVQALVFHRETRATPTVISMISEEDERLPLAKNVRATGPVEQWLLNVEHTMFDTVKLSLKKAITDYTNSDYVEWVLDHSGQVDIAVTQIMFNRLVTEALTSGSSMTSLNDVRTKLVTLLNSLASVVTRALSTHLYQTVVALIITLVHSRDITRDLIVGDVTSADDFAWTRHLRYEWDDEGNTCRVTQSLASFVYGYEYLGCSSRLVITPLTDRCYLTLTGAMHLNLGGAPAGPAGTGKTETVKDLAKAMGKQCLVFNCSEGLDFKMIGKFLSGLAQSGSWCCFDEFNRIDIEVLSVVAQQLHSIKVAKDTSAVRFFFEGRDIKLNPSCGAFITMNPGYAGRVDLPDNLKSLFRPVAMVVPDDALIAEIILFSEGFEDAASLSRKLVNIYQLASKQLSQQDHYDFGLRAIKAVLVMAGQQRRAASLERHVSTSEEACVMINAIKNANMPKFISDDVNLFERILADIFPEMKPPAPDHVALEKAIGVALRELSFQRWQSQIEKIIQLNETLLVRHGVMLVGPTGGGKSTIRKILRKSLVLLPSFHGSEDEEVATVDGSEMTSLVAQQVNLTKKGTVDMFSVNPKCISLGELYGEVDQMTMEWSDGLLAAAIRVFAKHRSTANKDRGSDSAGADSSLPVSRNSSRMSKVSNDFEMDVGDSQSQQAITDWQWVVLDGPVDTMWIENLNTVLDDTKVLCLANGERIPLKPTMRMIFEVDTLSQASPATVSRCGMVYLDPCNLGWRPFVRSWLNKLREKKVPESGRDHLHKLFESTIDPGLQFLEESRSFVSIAAPPLSVVSTLCSILSALIDHVAKDGGFGEPSQENVPETSSTILSTTDFAKSMSSNDFFVFHINTKKQSYLERNPTHLPQFFGKLYVFSFIWAFGGNFNCPSDESMSDIETSSHSNTLNDVPNARNSFDTFVKDLFESKPSLEVRLPAGNNSLYNYYVDLDKGQFTLWENLVPSSDALIEKHVANQIAISDTMNLLDDPMPSMSDFETRALIPTVDSVQYSFILSLLALSSRPVLLTGDTGVGKSALVRDVLKRLSQEGGAGTGPGTILGSVLSSGGSSLLESIVENSTERDGRRKKTVFISHMQFSAHTSTLRTRRLIESKLVKRGRDTLGAKPGKKVIVFVDDMNMPQPEVYGAQPPLELLRSFLDSGGFHDSKKLNWKEVHDVTLLSACAPPSGGRHAISPRLLRHLSVFCLPPPSSHSLHHIFGTILGRFLEPQEFSADIKSMRNDIIIAAIWMYQQIEASMRPTPSKCHYLFNLRDLSKVIYGLLQAHHSSIKSREHWIELLCHEYARVFYDRLTDDNDRGHFCNIMNRALKDNLKVKWAEDKYGPDTLVFGDFLDLNAGEHDRFYRCVRDPKQLAQVLEDYRDRASISGKSLSQSLVFFQQTIQHIARAARVFRQREGHMLLVGIGGSGKSSVAELAAYIEFCTFIKPSLTRNYSHSDFRDDIKKAYMTAGVKGQKTVLFLYDSLIAKEIFLEEVCSLLNLSQAPDIFDEEDKERISLELKKEAIEQGIHESKEHVFEFFLSRVRSRLHLVFATSPSGSLFRQRCRLYPSLINCCTIDWYDEWPSEALQAVAQAHLDAKDFSDDESNALLLHQAISNSCVSIHKSVEAASAAYLQELQRHFYVTPRSYIEFIQLYRSLLEKKRREYNFNLQRMSTGLRKVAESKEMVSVMKEELVNLGPVLEQRSKDTENLMAQLAKDREAVDKVRAVVQREEDITDKEAKRVEAIAESARKDLEHAMPQLQIAIEMLDALNKNDIVEVRAYTKPPTMVMTVMAAVCTLLGQKTDWKTAKHLLGEQGFLKRLVGYDRNSVTNRIYDRVKKITKNPDFNPTAIGKISKACKSMCAWVLALQNYTEVYRMVLPKQQKCEEAQEALAVAYENLQQKRSALKQVQDQLDSLQAQYDDSFAELEFLENKKEQSIVRLRRAAILTKSLADEEVRWEKSVESLSTQSDGLIGNTLLASASIAYTGALTVSYRNDLLRQWCNTCKQLGVPLTESYNVIDYLTEPITIQDWRNRGLPHDQVSVENAIFITNTLRWPYIIDPQSQAIRWVHELEAENGIKVIKASEMNLMRVLEPALRLGEPVIIEDAPDTLDPALDPILNMNTRSTEHNTTVKIGETEIEYNPKFRLYITTQSANPHLLPETCIKVCVVNFTVTLEGLQDQLLSNVVHQERPDLETQRCMLLESLVNDKMRLQKIEDRTLDLLSTSIGNVLDDENLINTLDNSKDMVGTIQRRLKDSNETQESIQGNRIVYSPVADRGAILYFVMSDLAAIDVMYQFSLNWFIALFSSCISTFETSTIDSTGASIASKTSTSTGSRKISLIEKARSFAARKQLKHRRSETNRTHLMNAGIDQYLRTMIELITETVYRVVSRAMFAQHQILFSFYLCARIHMHRSTVGKQLVEDIDWQCFLYGSKTKLFSTGDEKELSPRREGSSTSVTAQGSLGQLITAMTKPPAKWISQDSWQECLQLSDMISSFSGICSHIVNNPQYWLSFYNSTEPFRYLGEYDESTGDANSNKKASTGWSPNQLTNFQQLILIKIFRSECLLASVREYVVSEMGAKFVTPAGFDLQEFFEDSNCRTPLIFILSPGSDPTSELLRFAKDVRGSTLHLDMISLGRGQGPKAEELIKKAYSQKGKWVFLQNCHLAASFMPNLREIVRGICNPATDVDPQFRLWLSSKPDLVFPSPVLQAGLKMTVEPPPGLKANLQRSLANVTGILGEKISKSNFESIEWKRLLFGLCFFNAVVQERRKFGSLGWNISYEFINSDLEVSVLTLYDLLSENRKVPWKALKLLTGEIIYGGRVTDTWDQIRLLSLLEAFFNEQILNDGYLYLGLESYECPDKNIEFDELKCCVESLPSMDPPEVFGMHPNAETEHLKHSSKRIVESLILMQPRTSVVLGQGKSNDERVLEAIADIDRVLPTEVPVHSAGPSRASTKTPSRKTPSRSSSKSMPVYHFQKRESGILTNEQASASALVAFLRQEHLRYNELLQTVHASLDALQSAVRGEIVMSETLEATYSALLHNHVPLEWKKMSYSSVKPLASWIDNLMKRIDFIGRWIDLVKAKEKTLSRQQSRTSSSQFSVPSDSPRCFWLPAFYFPQGFLTAVLQSHARQNSVAVDSLSFEYQVTNSYWCPQDTGSDKDIDINAVSFEAGSFVDKGILIAGLFLDGAKWNVNENTLEESSPKQRFSPLPEAQLVPTQVERTSKQDEKEDSGRSYLCPVYQTSLRTSSLTSSRHTMNFVSSIRLRTSVHEDHWIRRGVALLCQTDD